MKLGGALETARRFALRVTEVTELVTGHGHSLLIEQRLMGATEMKTTITTLAAALAAAIALAPMAQAAEQQPETITVTAAGLDLNTQAGARTMLTRIDSAATTACWQDKLDKMDAYRNCKAGVMLDAVKVLDEPMVSLVYAETYSTKKTPNMVLASR